MVYYKNVEYDYYYDDDACTLNDMYKNEYF